MRFVLVEATGRILPEVGEDLGRYTVERAARAQASTSGSTPGSSPASTGTSCSPTATSSTPRRSSGPPGSRPTRCSPRTDLPLDDKGRLRCRADLRVEGVDDAWSRRRRRGGARPHRAAGRAAPARAPSTPSGRPRCSATTSSLVLHGRSADRLRAQVRRVGRLARPAQGRRPGLRHQAARLPGLVHAPDLPREPGADAQPQGPGRPRLDAGAVLQAATSSRSGRCSGRARSSARRPGDRRPGPLAVTVIGHDRPGIIADTTRLLAELGGNLEDSTMTILRGHFAMVAARRGRRHRRRGRGRARAAGADGTLQVSVREVPEEAPAAGARRDVPALGARRRPARHRRRRSPAVVAEAGGNITDLSTRLTGELYVLLAEVDLPGSGRPRRAAPRPGRGRRELGVEASLRVLDPDVL